jgi:hypothetical protein
VALTQAPIPIENPEIFDELKAAVEAALAPAAAERFLRSVQRKRLRVREFEAVIAAGLLGEIDAAGLYRGLSTSDQAQMREFYLLQVEEVAPGLRQKFANLYSYY